MGLLQHVQVKTRHSIILYIKANMVVSVCVDKNWAMPGRFFQSLPVPIYKFTTPPHDKFTIAGFFMHKIGWTVQDWLQ
jgi:hypothetical protein